MNFNCTNKNLENSYLKQQIIKKTEEEEKSKTEKEEALKQEETKADIILPKEEKVTAKSEDLITNYIKAAIKIDNPKTAATQNVDPKTTTKQNVNPKTASTQNTGVTTTEVEDKETNKIDKATLNGGHAIDLEEMFNNLVQEWNNNAENNWNYSTKLQKMQSIINVADRIAHEYATANGLNIDDIPAPGSETYTEGYAHLQGLIDQANTWRCYRFIMRNNYRQALYEDIRQRLNQGVPYDEILNDPEIIEHLYLDSLDPNDPEIGQQLIFDMTRGFWPDEEKDFRTTNIVYEYVYQTDENGNIVYDENGDPVILRDENGNPVYELDESGHRKFHFEYDNEGFQYFGGKTEFDDNGDIVYTKNENLQLRFLYNEAMINSYKVKIMAIQIRLKGIPNDEEHKQVRDKLNSDMRDYQRLLRAMLDEEANLLEAINAPGSGYEPINYIHEGENGETIYDIPGNRGLVPGLMPAASTNGVNGGTSGEENPDFEEYNDMKARYKESVENNDPVSVQRAYVEALLDKAETMYNREIQFQNGKPRWQWHNPDASFWQSEMLHWQRVLQDLDGNTSHAGHGTTTVSP